MPELPDPQSVFDETAHPPFFERDGYKCIPLEYLSDFHARLLEVCQTTLEDVRSGNAGVMDFCLAMDPVSRYGTRLSSIHTRNFEEYCRFFRMHFPEQAEISILQDQGHTAIAEKFGLPVKYGMICAYTEPEIEGAYHIETHSAIQPFIDDDLEFIAVYYDWKREKLLSYIDKVASAVEIIKEGDFEMMSNFPPTEK